MTVRGQATIDCPQKSQLLFDESRHVILPQQSGHALYTEEGHQAIELVAYRSRSELFLLEEIPEAQKVAPLNIFHIILAVEFQEIVKD